MAIDGKKTGIADSLRADRTFGKVRCHNPSCMERIVPEPGANHAKCAICGMEYRIYWVNPKLPRIRGPVWEVNRRLAQEKFEAQQAAAQKESTKKGGN